MAFSADTAASSARVLVWSESLLLNMGFPLQSG